MSLAERIATPSAPRNAQEPGPDTIPRQYNFAADILTQNLAAGRAAKPAFLDPRAAWTYGDLAGRVERFGHVLRKLDIRREERILICLLDSIDWPTAFLGAIKAGVIAVPVNTLLTEDDYRYMLNDSRARLLVVSEALYPKFADIVGACPELARVIVSGDDAHGHHRFEDLLQEASGPAFTATTTRDDVCWSSPIRVAWPKSLPASSTTSGRRSARRS